MKDQNVWVSVIIPTYNRKNVVSKAIDSCLKQTYSNVEIVICDDHSGDGTLDFLKNKYELIDNIKYCVTPEGKKGANAARNEGIRASKGELIAFLDDDDELVEDSIEIRVNSLLSTNSALVYGNAYYKPYDEEAPVLIQFDDISEYDQKKFLMRELALCSMITIMLKREVIEKTGGFDETLSAWQDDDLVLSIGMKYKIWHCQEPVAIIRGSETSIGSNKKNPYLGCKGIVRKYKKEIIEYTSYGRYCLWKIRIIALWAKYREQNSKLLIMKIAYRMFYRIIYKLIGGKKFFRRW